MRDAEGLVKVIGDGEVFSRDVIAGLVGVVIRGEMRSGRGFHAD